MRRSFAIILGVSLLGAGIQNFYAAASRPNIIYILTDDHGYTDLGVQGFDPHLQTPNLDSLATNGVRLTQGYCTAPQCSPSRAAVMTGRYQNRIGFLNNNATPMPLVAPDGQPVVTIAERIRAKGYRTGQVGKWHLDPDANSVPGWPGVAADYAPDHRGFVDQFTGYTTTYTATFDLNGNDISRQVLTFNAGLHRIDIQTDAARAFIQRAHDRSEPFFLYLAYYAPHVPRLTDTNYYANFPVVDYPQFDATGDDIRRQGLAILKAVDTGIGRVVQKLRDLNIETNTLILFAGDNGAPLGTQANGSRDTVAWNGSENLPLRGEKGSTWEGGIRIPMLMYWKNTLPAGLVYEKPVTTMDLSATAVSLAGTNLPPVGYDGVNLLPYLTGAAAGSPHENIFWNYGIPTWGYLVNVRHGDWKLRKFSDKYFLFNLGNDPYEVTNLAAAMPMKVAELDRLATGYLAELPTNGVAALRSVTNTTGDTFYQAAISTTARADTDGDGMSDLDEPDRGRDAHNASDLAFEFNIDNYFEGWTPVEFLISYAVTNGFLTGQATNNQGKFEFYDFNFPASNVNNLIFRLRSPQASSLTFRWGNTVSNIFAQIRTLTVAYQTSNVWQTVVVPLKGQVEWDAKTITRMRVNPVNKLADFEIDWMRGSTGDLDGDGLPDTYEAANGYDAANPADGLVDADGDGYSRGQEYILGTSDTDALSTLQLLGQRAGDGGMSFSWAGKAGRQYQLWRSFTLQPGSWTVIHSTGTLSTNATVQVSDPGAAGTNTAFYRIEALLP